MTPTLNTPNPTAPADAPRRVVWLPADRLRRYEWAKVVGAVFFVAIFSGWLFIQWSNPVMRVVASALLVLTATLTVGSIVGDLRRSRGREVAVVGDELELITPSGVTRVPLAAVRAIRWREDESPGLFFLGVGDKPLVVLDLDFLQDQSEARTFMGWLRQHSLARPDVQWPSV